MTMNAVSSAYNRIQVNYGKAAQTPNGAPHRRRHRRPAGSAPQAPQQPAREGKAPHSRAGRAPGPLRPQPQRPRAAECARANGSHPAAGRADPPNRRASRHRARMPPAQRPAAPQNAPQNARPAAPQPPRRNARPAPQVPSQPLRDQPKAPRPPRNACTPRSTAPEQPGLDLISRRPPKQKFANFEGLSRRPRRYDCAAAARGIGRSGHPRDGHARRGCRMTPATAAALRCPRMRRAAAAGRAACAVPEPTALTLPKEGYAYLCCRCRRSTPPTPATARPWSAPAARSCRQGTTPPLMATLAALCAALPHDHIVDAGCGEGSYDKYLYDALGCPQIAAFDLSKEAVRLASKLVPDAAFCVGGSFCAPVRDGWGRPAFEHLLAHGRG